MTSLFAREVALYTTALEVGSATGVFSSPRPRTIWRTDWWPWRTATACTSSAATRLSAWTEPVS